MHHLNLAHGLAVQEIRREATNDPDLSITLNLHVIRGDDATTPEAARRIDALANRAFTHPILKGEYPADLLEDTAGVTDWAFVQHGRPRRRSTSRSTCSASTTTPPSP